MEHRQAQELISELYGIRRYLALLVELKAVEINADVLDAVAEIDHIVADWDGI